VKFHEIFVGLRRLGVRVRGGKEGESYAIKAILMQAKGFD